MSKARWSAALFTLVLGSGSVAPVGAQPVAALRARVACEHVPPQAGEGPPRWVTRVFVSVETPTAADLAIYLSAESPAVLSTPYVEIPRGSLSASVEVTAEEKGDAEICAWTELSSALAALPGLGFGLVAYGLVAFLPANDLPGIIRPLAALPVTSGLASAVLGLAGGYGGRRFLPVGSPTPRAAAVGSTGPVEALSRS